ncbi:lipoate--protein ligase [Paenibacillus montaniterrae]|uniref:lipoate--protein ligase n=1 Tax=Paenibacillus montaniterrae TaxID=429341 RepID=A0A920CYZ4_9BACL|nr:lipoate--protein ligase [Paenibacillus montaniterrae]GIP17915.1 lipoate--protein ligase [Paenibacillus montaniterrae]
MLFVSNEQHHDPAVNLALEEYIFRQLPENNYLLFYINEPSIIIGKNQNTVEEINADYVKQHGIHIVRRMSGGGAVYHDLGNLNFSFIMKDDGSSFHNFKKFTEPVVAALRELGVEAELSGRNDIQVGERKISGNAQFHSRGKIISHGTLLFNSEMENVASALKVNAEKYVSKSTKSVRSRVANISEFLREPLTIEQFRLKILHSIFAGHDEVPSYKLTEEDWKKVYQLADERYRSWEWNYGRSPQFNMQQRKRIEGAGTFDVRLNVEDGVIKDAAIYGDFFGRGDRNEVAEQLVGVRYDEQALRAVSEQLDLPYYFGPITLDDWMGLLL